MPDPAQYQGALASGTPIRQAISRMKRALAAGELSPADALNGDSAHELGVKHCRVGLLLVAIPGIGKETMIAICDETRLDRDDRIKGLGFATRAELLRLVLMALETPGTAPVVPDDSWRQP